MAQGNEEMRMVKDWPQNRLRAPITSADRQRRSRRPVDGDQFEKGLVDSQGFIQGFADLRRTTPALATATRVLNQFAHAAHTAANGLADG